MRRYWAARYAPSIKCHLHIRLRASDAVYVAVAQRFGADLVTLDQEQRERVSTVLRTFKPAELLELEHTD